jgi:glycosyltransferase involved in cell wall biosynthesis
MHLLFDLAAAQPQSHGFHGGGEYAKEIFFELTRVEARGVRISAYVDEGRDIGPDILKAAEERGVHIHTGLGVKGLENLLSKERVDRFFSALPYDYHGMDFSRLEVFFTIHGLRAVEMPFDSGERHYLDFQVAQTSKWLVRGIGKAIYKRKRLKEFRRLLTVPARRRTFFVPSEHTKFTLLAALPSITHKEVVVCFSPVPAVTRIDEPDLDWVSSIGLRSRQYFLIVSADRWIKNGYRAVEAIDKLLASRPNIEPRQIAVVGGARCRAYERWSKDYLLLPQVSDKRLAGLYQNAFALVFPTLNEGFGYPPLEAMRYGTPVLASAVTSVPEVCGDAVLYYCPRSELEMQARVLQLCSGQAVWQEYSRRAKARSAIVNRAQNDHLRDLIQHLIQAEVASESR